MKTTYNYEVEREVKTVDGIIKDDVVIIRKKFGHTFTDAFFIDAIDLKKVIELLQSKLK